MMPKGPSRDEESSRDPGLEAAFARMVQQAEAPLEFVARVLAKTDARPVPRQKFFTRGPLWRAWPAPMLARAALVVGCVLFLAVAAYRYVHWAKEDGSNAARRDADTELATTEPQPDESLRQDILQRLASAPACTKITVDVRSGIVDLGGRVASEEQHATLRREVQNTKGVVHINDALRIIPPPLCEVVELMEPLMARAEAQGLDWSASLKKVERDGTLVPVEGIEPIYYAGEHLAIEVRTPAQSESFVYVDYYPAFRTMAHLFSPHVPLARPGLSARPLPPNTSLLIGHPSEPLPRWIMRIAPPFGQELITVIVSTAPLFPAQTQRSPSVVLLEPYIDSLRRVLTKDGPRSDVTGMYYVIRTQARP